LRTDPTVDASSVVSDEESIFLLGLHEVQIDVTLDADKYDVVLFEVGSLAGHQGH
jgi:hypothetical protein